MGVRAKLFLVSLLLILFVGISSGFFVEQRLRTELENRVEADLLRLAKATRETVRAQPQDQSPQALDHLIDRVGRATHMRITIIDPQGTVIADSDLDGEALRTAQRHDTRPEVVKALASGVGFSRRQSSTLGARMLYVAVPFNMSSPWGRGVIRTATPLLAVDSMLHKLRVMLLLAGLVGLGVAVFMSGIASHLMSLDLRRLVDQAQEIVQGGGKRLEVSSTNELGWLAAALNRMADGFDSTVAALANERDLVGTILQSMEEGVVALDSELRISLINEAAIRLLGLSHDPNGQNFATAAPIGELFDLLTQGLLSPSSAEISLPGGNPKRVVLARATPMLAGRGVVLVMHDVTEMRRLERMRKDFVANVSHELRTPVTVMLANAETLLGGALAHPDKAQRFVEAMHRNAQRLSDVITDLLSLSRIEAGRVSLNAEPVLLGEVVSTALVGVEDRADSRGTTIDTDLGDGLRVRADAKALVHVLTNLLDNAVKYSPDGSTIWVRATLKDKRVLIEVEDQGPGIPLKYRDRIFERFYRLDKGRARDTGGTGLGLAIVRHLVDAMGGLVGVGDGRDHRGSRFWVELPQAEMPQHQETAA